MTATNAEDRYDSLFQFYGHVYSVDWLLLKAQAHAESDFDPDATSKVGAKGLTQFMDRTWQEWNDGTPGIQDAPKPTVNPYDPEDAIKAQAAYMAWLLRMFDDNVAAALAAYNWGIGHVQSMNRQSPDWLMNLPKETIEYIQRVMKSNVRFGEESVA